MSQNEGSPEVGIVPSLPHEVALELTARQQEVLALLAAGLTADEIGTRLEISGRTARAHLDVLRRKLRVRRTRELPLAFRARTGVDPLSLLAVSSCVELAQWLAGI